MNAADRMPASPRITRTLHAVGFVAAVVLATAAQGEACSGGSAGGTDATGNQCNDPVAIAASGDRSANEPSATLDANAAKPVAAAASPPPMTAAEHRKKLFDERRARFADGGAQRVAAAPARTAVAPRNAP